MHCLHWCIRSCSAVLIYVMVHCNICHCWPVLHLYKAGLCTCRCRLSESQSFCKIQTCRARHSVMSRRQHGVAAYTSSQTEVSHKQASVSSPIEEQLSAQHQHPAELLELQRQNGSLILNDGTALLEGLTRTTTVAPHAAGGVVLGFSVANGAVASQDFPVGKVHKLAQETICHACSTSCSTACVQHNKQSYHCS